MRIVFIFLLASLNFSTYAQADIKLQYLANMGVLLSDGENAVLIDALHTPYKAEYLYPHDTIVEAILEGHFVEAEIHYLLVSHLHKDHYAPSLVDSFLIKNENARMIASSQAVAQLKGAYGIRAKGLEMGEFHKEMKDDLTLMAFACEHVNKMHAGVENLSFVVSFSGKNVLHVGDSNWDELINCLTHKVAAGLEFEAIILPYWMYYDSNLRDKLKKIPNSKKYYAAHLPPDFSETEGLLEKLPELILLQEPNKVY